MQAAAGRLIPGTASTLRSTIDGGVEKVNTKAMDIASWVDTTILNLYGEMKLYVLYCAGAVCLLVSTETALPYPTLPYPTHPTLPPLPSQQDP